MFKGFCSFKCTQCGNKFSAPHIEYLATIYPAPQQCPQCGSMITRPAGLFGKLHEGIYRKIWEKYEEENLINK